MSFAIQEYGSEGTDRTTRPASSQADRKILFPMKSLGLKVIGCGPLASRLCTRCATRACQQVAWLWPSSRDSLALESEALGAWHREARAAGHFRRGNRP